MEQKNTADYFIFNWEMLEWWHHTSDYKCNTTDWA